MWNKISSIIKYKLPEFVQEDYEIFVAFIQAYYEWLEESGNVLYFIERFKDNQDVDLADDEYIEMFIKELADTFPKNILIDKSMLLKVIKEFYLTKGSEKSFRFIFRILYDADIEVFYPRIFMHESSNGKWDSNKYAHITGNNFYKLSLDNDDLSASIEGVTSGAKAIIDSITSTYYDDQQILKLDISSNHGEFIPDEDVILRVDDNEFVEKIYGGIIRINVVDGGTNYTIDDEIVITTSGNGDRAKAKIKKLSHGGFDTITIVNGGSGYSVGELIYATKTLDSAGYGFLAEVYSVDGSGAITGARILNRGRDYDKPTLAYVVSDGGSGAQIRLNGDVIGKIESIEVFDFGIGYTNVSDISISVVSDEGVGAILEPELGGIWQEPKHYVSQDDWLSDYSRIQDSYYYQHFSYVIKSNITPSRWIDTIKRVAHPAGTQLFGMYQLYNTFDISILLPDNVTRTISYIRNIITGAVIDDIDFSHRTFELEWVEDETCSIGTTYLDLDIIKFSQLFNYTVGDFTDLTIRDVSEKCIKPMNKVEDSTMVIT